MQATATLLWSLAQLGYQPNRKWLERWWLHMQGQAHRYGPQDVQQVRGGLACTVVVGVRGGRMCSR